MSMSNKDLGLILRQPKLETGLLEEAIRPARALPILEKQNFSVRPSVDCLPLDLSKTQIMENDHPLDLTLLKCNQGLIVGLSPKKELNQEIPLDLSKPCATQQIQSEQISLSELPLDLATDCHIIGLGLIDDQVTPIDLTTNGIRISQQDILQGAQLISNSDSKVTSSLVDDCMPVATPEVSKRNTAVRNATASYANTKPSPPKRLTVIPHQGSRPIAAKLKRHRVTGEVFESNASAARPAQSEDRRQIAGPPVLGELPAISNSDMGAAALAGLDSELQRLDIEADEFAWYIFGNKLQAWNKWHKSPKPWCELKDSVRAKCLRWLQLPDCERMAILRLPETGACDVNLPAIPRELDTEEVARQFKCELRRLDLEPGEFARLVLGCPAEDLAGLLDSPRPWDEVQAEAKSPGGIGKSKTSRWCYRQMWLWLQKTDLQKGAVFDCSSEAASSRRLSKRLREPDTSEFRPAARLRHSY